MTHSQAPLGMGIDMGLAGKTAIVCGSSAGLGKACAAALARCGADVTVNGRDEAKLKAAAASIERDTGAKVRTAAADVTTAEGRAALLAVTPAPDILVNNAAGPPPGDFRTWTEADWLKALNANMLSAIHLTTAVIDGMIQRKWGRGDQYHLGCGQDAGADAGPVHRRPRRPYRFHGHAGARSGAARGHGQQHAARILRDRPHAELHGDHRRRA